MKAKKRPFKHYRLRVNGRVVAYYNTGKYSLTMAESHAKGGRRVTVDYRMTHVNVGPRVTVDYRMAHVNVGQWFTIWKGQ